LSIDPKSIVGYFPFAISAPKVKAKDVVMAWTTKIEDLALPRQQETTSVRFLRLEQVMEITQLCRSSIYQLQRSGEFPASVTIGKRGARFVETEVTAWMTARIASRHKQSVGEL
jgi:prophage regulatory protein